MYATFWRQRAQHPVVSLHRVHTRTQTHTSPEMEGGKREIWGGVWVGGNVHVQAWAIAQRDALLTFAVSSPLSSSARDAQAPSHAWHVRVSGLHGIRHLSNVRRVEAFRIGKANHLNTRAMVSKEHQLRDSNAVDNQPLKALTRSSSRGWRRSQIQMPVVCASRVCPSPKPQVLRLSRESQRGGGDDSTRHGHSQRRLVTPSTWKQSRARA